MGFPMTVERAISRNGLDRSNRNLMDDLRRLAEDSATLALREAQARTAVPETEKLREAIGTGEAGVGLPHWHHASGGTSPDPAENDRAGVFVDRQAVLDLIERVLR